MDRKEVLRRLRDALSKEIDVKQVYLFGSQATGTFDEGSDYDVAVISDDFEEMGFQERQMKIRPLVRDALGIVPIDVVCYTPDEFEQGKKAFLPRIIQEEGVPLY